MSPSGIPSVFLRVEGAIFGAALHGGRAHLVRIETVLGRGLSKVVLVGMPDAVAREARERLPAALQRHGFRFPKGRVLFNLFPAQLPKGGLPLDLALAVGLLVADRQLPRPRTHLLFLAELDLEGRLGPPARGTLLAAMRARGRVEGLITAPEAAPEAALAPGFLSLAAADLGAVAEILRAPAAAIPADAAAPEGPAAAPGTARRLDDVRGQGRARRAAAVAAAGRHPVLLQGPPGTGKSLLARRIAGLLPPLGAERALELAQVEAALRPVRALPREPPLRAPHTTVSPQALLGGGRPLRPGELSRAHGGVLFLDELPEFARPVLEGLRQPLEEQEVRLQRAQEWAVFPADVLLVAARNPCPCGFDTHPSIPCTCTPARKQSYALRTSGPLLDRFDLFVEMGPVAPEELQGPPTPPHDEDVARWLAAARERQERRRRASLPGEAGRLELAAIQEEGVAAEAEAALNEAASAWRLSARACLRCLRVARTVADLAGGGRVERAHLLEALSYRLLAREEATSRG